MTLGYGRVSTNNFSTADYIVDGDGLQKGATHTTIQAAIDDASAGENICVRPGTYTENITLKSDICLFSDAHQVNDAGDAAIVGKVSLGTAANATVIGFRMTDNADVIIEDTGSTSGTVTFQLCSISGDGSHNVINCTNTNRVLTLIRCGLSSPAGAKILNSSGGTIIFRFSTGSAGASTPSTISAGSLSFTNCLGCFPFATSGTATFTISNSTLTSTNQTLIDHQATTQGILQMVSMRTNGSAVAMNIGAGATVVSTQLDINTANATPVSGTGTLNYDSIGFIQNAPNALAPTLSMGSLNVRSLELENALDETYGGTGQTTYATGDVLYASGVDTLAKLVAGTAGQVLNMSGGVPAWTSALTNLTSGTFSSFISTPAITAPATFNMNINAATGFNYNTNLGDNAGANVFNINNNSGAAQMTVNSLGVITLATWNGDTITETYGGTNQSTYTAGDILYASAANTLSKLAIGSDGEVLTLASGLPSWAAVSVTLPNEVFYYKASDFDALETNFAPLLQDNGSNAKVLVRAFDDSTEEYVNFSLKAPEDIDTSGTVTFRVWMYAATAAASKNVALTFDHRPLDNSESWDQTYTSEDSGDIAIDATQDDITEATWTETVTNLAWAANDIVLCRLSRPDASANDLVGDLNVLGFAVEIPRS